MQYSQNSKVQCIRDLVRSTHALKEYLTRERKNETASDKRKRSQVSKITLDPITGRRATRRAHRCVRRTGDWPSQAGRSPPPNSQTWWDSRAARMRVASPILFRSDCARLAPAPLDCKGKCRGERRNKQIKALSESESRGAVGKALFKIVPKRHANMNKIRWKPHQILRCHIRLQRSELGVAVCVGEGVLGNVDALLFRTVVDLGSSVVRITAFFQLALPNLRSERANEFEQEKEGRIDERHCEGGARDAAMAFSLPQQMVARKSNEHEWSRAAI